MIRNTLIFAAVIVTAAGCARGTIVVKNDDFKKSTIVRMDLDHPAQTDARQLVYMTYGCTYEREIVNGRKQPALYHVRMITSVLSKDLKNEAYVKIDDSVRRMAIGNVATDTHEEVRRTNEKTDKPEKTVDTVKVSENKIMTATLSFTPEMEKLILQANTLQYRLYAQSDAITLTVSKKDIERLKAFLLAPEETHTTRVSGSK